MTMTNRAWSRYSVTRRLPVTDFHIQRRILRMFAIDKLRAWNVVRAATEMAAWFRAMGRVKRRCGAGGSL